VARAKHHEGIKPQARKLLADGDTTTRQVHTLLEGGGGNGIQCVGVNGKVLLPKLHHLPNTKRASQISPYSETTNTTIFCGAVSTFCHSIFSLLTVCVSCRRFCKATYPATQDNYQDAPASRAARRSTARDIRRRLFQQAKSFRHRPLS